MRRLSIGYPLLGVGKSGTKGVWWHYQVNIQEIHCSVCYAELLLIIQSTLAKESHQHSQSGLYSKGSSVWNLFGKWDIADIFSGPGYHMHCLTVSIFFNLATFGSDLVNSDNRQCTKSYKCATLRNENGVREQLKWPQTVRKTCLPSTITLLESNNLRV